MKNSTAAFFDLDKTLIKGNLYIIFLKMLQKQRWTTVFSYFYLIPLMIISKMLNNNELIRHGMIFSIRNMKRNEVINIWRKYVIENKETIFIKSTLNALRKHKENQLNIIILTNNLDVLVDPIVEILEVDDFVSITTTMNNKGGIKLPNLLKVISIVKTKEIERIAAQQQINLLESFGYGDSKEDYDFLRIVGHPFLIKDNDEIVSFVGDC
jgi:HAD superfamily phosphoserine phosphatase-like hydrolase